MRLGPRARNAPVRPELADGTLRHAVVTDFELLAAWRDGDAQAGNTLFERHHAGVLRFFEIKVPSDADDLAQQTMMACVESHTRFAGRSSFKSYLFGIARHVLFRHLRDKKRLERLASFERMGGDTPLSPSGVVAMREEQRLFLRAFSALSEDMQTAIQLFYWEGLSTSDIAEVFDTTVTAVTSRLSRARTKLREQVEAISYRAEVRNALLGDLEGWTRSLVNTAAPRPG